MNWIQNMNRCVGPTETRETMSATPRTDALEKAVSLGMIGSQLFDEVRKLEKELDAMTEGLKIASACACDFTVTRHPCGSEDFHCGCQQMMVVVNARNFQSDGCEPISAEAAVAGLKFCCGKEERLTLEIAALRNVVQAAMSAGCVEAYSAWNYHFPERPMEPYKTPNDRVEGRDAASSRRVPSHDGLCGNGSEVSAGDTAKG